ncbi:MAG: YdiU family protein [Pseudomonadota bacterium]
MTLHVNFDNTYARLPERFFTRIDPTPVKSPRLLKLNTALAEELGLVTQDLQSEQGVAWMAGNSAAHGSEPLSQAYAGHQFGGWVPQLGDGRAHLLGEVIDRKGQRRDIQLKGSGRTPYSRMGDGRAWLGPVLREYIVSEAMHSFGIPTTRALAVVATGEDVLRETPLPGAVLTRVASSHIRVGTFQYFAARQDRDALQLLTDHAIARHHPEAVGASNPVLAFLGSVVAAQAELVAGWMALGFIHGVMNTDNTTISGETIDYGPCAFIDGYHPEKVFSSIDQFGRYAYRNQPDVLVWNLAQLASSLLPLIDDDTDKAVALATEAIHTFPSLYQAAWLTLFRAKLGLQRQEADDADLVQGLLDAMAGQLADFTNTFRALSEDDADDGFENPAAFAAWNDRYLARLAREDSDVAARHQRMRKANPAIIPRNHRIEEVIQAALSDDFDPFERLIAALARPFEIAESDRDLTQPPRPEEAVVRTFCGT